MRLAYFDCFSGISGDMILGAMVDAGLSLSELKHELSKLKLKGYKLKQEKVKRSGIAATKLDVLISSKDKVHTAKKWQDIARIIEASSLSPLTKEKGLEIMRRLFEAEAKAHGEEFDKVHLHELGALDCIIDVFGAIIGLDILGLKNIYSSPLNLGSGFVTTAHGNLPVPAPATANIIKGIPAYSTGIPFELTTPTGAAIITTISDGFSSFPPLMIKKIGCGAGTNDIKGQPNILRLFIGNSNSGYDYDSDEVIVVETNIDDMNPQVYEHLIERLFDSGALDVYLVPIVMKKSRPAHLLSVLAERGKMDGLIDIIFKETTTFGVRFHSALRYKLSREIREIKTRYGNIRAKIGRKGNSIFTVAPEYEDCKAVARNKEIPLNSVIDEARRKAESIRDEK